MDVLNPITLTDAMLSASSIAEPAASETAWVSAGTYALGDYRIRTTTHRVYKAKQAHTGRTALPEVDTDYWLDYGPTLRWSAFDQYTSTASTATTSLSYTLRPGFFNCLAFLGLDAGDIAVTVKDAPGGAVIYSFSGSLQEPPLDWYDYAFGTIKGLTKLILSGITPYPDPEVSITITAAAGVTVRVGMVAVGDLRSLLGEAEWGGTECGASAEPVTYSYIKTDEYGNTTIVRRHAATDLRVRVVMPRAYADAALVMVQDVLDVPCVWVATQADGYAGLTVFGLGSGQLSYDSFNHAVFNIAVKGMI